MPDVEFIPIGTLGDGSDGETIDFARSRARWQALPDGWLSAKDMREALKQVCRIPPWDDAAAEAALWAMSDFLEVRGPASAREYRAVETPPEPMSAAQVIEGETARLAALEREHFERELSAREAKHAERDQVYLDGNRRLHRELADEYTVPMIRALEARIEQLERQLAQAQPEAAAAVSAQSTIASTEAPRAAGFAARARDWLTGGMSEAEFAALRAREEADDDGEDD